MKSIELRGNDDLEILIQKIISSNKEELIVVFGRTSSTQDGLLFLVNEINFADESYISRSQLGLKWDAELTAKWVRKAEMDKMGIVLIHAHSGGSKVDFSTVDLKTKRKMLKHFNMYLPHSASGYVVVNSVDIRGEFIYENKTYDLELMRSVGCPTYMRGKKNRERFIPSPKHHRQELALGENASRILRNSTIAVVGLGGAGSMVVEQLGHLGVGEIILVDGDKLEKSNLSRVVSSSVKDIGLSKVEISARLVKSIDNKIKLKKIKEFAPTKNIYDTLKNVSVIISCVDKINAKLALNNFSKRYLLPLIDVGITIRRQGNTVTNINGQVIRVNPSNNCLKCFGIISKILEKKESIEHYGAKVKNPQVITYNGVIASLAVGEMLKILTGIAGEDYKTSNLGYDGLTGEVIRVEGPNFKCDVCKSQFAQGDPN